MTDVPPQERELDPAAGAAGLRPPELERALHAAFGPELEEAGRARPAGASLRGGLEVLGEIARGGMGVILRGHDRELGREVAVKVLREDRARDDEVLQRFVGEARICGRLQHPGVVPVYELGRASDCRPYFAMKLVRGRTLAELLAERSSPRDLHRSLAVFERVCQTLAYAHSRGVIHRDLKPANVMVGAFDEVQVVDWGLAKVLAREDGAAEPHAVPAAAPPVTDGGSSSLSRDGSVMGTAAYMPPEQARGEVERLDERADVFALGATLCEILTGAPPYPGPTREALRAAAGGELDPARERLAACIAEPELVQLALECLAPDPADRPRHAGLLASRLEDHRAAVEERVQEARVGAAEARVKAREERRARRLTTALSLLVLITLGLGAGAWAWVEGREARRQVEIDARTVEALAQARHHERREEWAEVASAARRARALLGVLPAGAPLRVVRASELEGLERRAREGLRAEFVTLENAQLLARLGEIRRPANVDDHYPTDWRRAARDYASVFREHGFEPLDEPAAAAERAAGRGLGPEFAAALDEWGLALTRCGDAEAAATLGELAQELDPDPERGRLREVLRRGDVAELSPFAGRAETARLPVATLVLLSRALLDLGRPAEAVRVAGAAQRRHPAEFGANLAFASALEETGQPREAARFFQAALALRPEAVEVRHQLGRSLEAAGLAQEAAEHFRETLAQRPADAHLHWHLAHALESAGEPDAARASYARAVELDPADFEAWTNLGRLELLRSDAVAALPALRAAAVLRPGEASAHDLLGTARERTGDAEGAERSYRRALELDPGFALARYNLGILLGARGELDAALAELRKAVRLAPEDPEAWTSFGNYLSRAGRTAEALAALGEAVRLDPGEPRYAFNLGCAHAKDGAWSAAIQAYRAALRLDPDYPQVHCNLAGALANSGEHGAALAGFRRCHELGSARDGWPYPSRDWLEEAEQRAAAWLREEVVRGREELARGDPTRLRRLASDPDLASLRDAGRLETLSPERRDELRVLWSEVSRLVPEAE